MTGLVETATPWGQAALSDLVELKGAADVAVPWGQADTSDTGDPIGASPGAEVPLKAQDALPKAQDAAATGGGRITFSPRLSDGAGAEIAAPRPFVLDDRVAEDEGASEPSPTSTPISTPISVSPIRALLALSSAWLLGCTCLLVGFCACSAWSRSSSSGAVRTYVEELPVSRAEEVRRRLPASGGYDCAISRPMSSRQLLRLEAQVGQPAAGNMLTAPLTQERCVVYASSASKLLHDGVHPVPMAFSSASVDFCVTLTDDPLLRIEVSGEDVCLFEMCNGRHVEQRSFDQIPDAWSDFISQHRTAPHLSALMRPDGAAVEFQECKLAVGTVVTLVGELHRSADGALSLRPQIGGGPAPQAAPRECWRTSWESAVGGAPSALEPGLGAGTRIEKVLVSDDPSFLGVSKSVQMFRWATQHHRCTSWTKHMLKKAFRRPPSPSAQSQESRARGSPPPSPASGPRTSTPAAGSELRSRLYTERP